MKKVNFQSRNGQNITISALINFPDRFDEGKKYPAVIFDERGTGEPGRRSDGPGSLTTTSAPPQEIPRWAGVPTNA